MNRFDGQSGGATPGLFPNPEVKPTCVLRMYCGTKVHGKRRTLSANIFFVIFAVLESPLQRKYCLKEHLGLPCSLKLSHAFGNTCHFF